MPDNWSFVAAAYGLTALVLGIYWRRLVHKEAALERAKARPASVGRTSTSVADRSRSRSRPGHPRREPDANPSLKTERKSGAP
jgi:hypothetical protein